MNFQREAHKYALQDVVGEMPLSHKQRCSRRNKAPRGHCCGESRIACEIAASLDWRIMILHGG